MVNLASGTLVDARYEIIEQIGEGGIGTVFKAKEIGTERTVALKMLHLTLIGDQDSLERFRREGALLARLEHPHIMRCYRFGVWNERWPYISTEFLEGQSLHSVSDMNESRAVAIVRQACIAMDYAHQQNIIHRDLKPANIMVLQQDGADFVKVVDFGLARVLPKIGEASQHLTQTGTLIGSIYYMSPEQCMGKKADARSDIYSVGCILYELLSGQPPLTADTPVGLMHLHATAKPAPLEGVTPGLNAIVMRAMAKNADRRFQSMLEFAAALELVAAGRGAEVEDFVEVDTPAKRNRLSITGLGLTVMLTVTLFAFGSLINNLRLDSHRSTATSDTYVTNLVSRNLQLTSEYGSLFSEDSPGLPNEQLLNSWITKNGRDPEGVALANYYLYLNRKKNRQKAEDSAKLARKALDTLLRSSRLKRKNIDRSDLFWAIITIDSDISNEFSMEMIASEYFAYRDCLSTDGHDVAHRVAALLNDRGAYEAEERVLHSLRPPAVCEEILLTRCKFRQQKFYPKRFIVRVAIPEMAKQTVASALIEMGEFDQAREFLYSNSFAMRATMNAFCLTSQRKFRQSREFLREQWLNLASNNDSSYGLLSRRLPVKRAFLIAALVHNSIKEGRSNSAELNAFVKDIEDDAVSLTVAAYLCSRDDRSVSERLSRLAAKRLVEDSSSKENNELLTLLARTTNDINKPLIALPLLRKAISNGEKPAITTTTEYLRALRLVGRFSEATPLIERFAKRDWSKRHTYFQATRFDIEFAWLCLEAGDTKSAKQQITNCLSDVSTDYYSLIDRVELLEELAAIESRLQDKTRSKDLLAESARILPPWCRTHWDNWTMFDAADVVAAQSLE